MLPSVLSYLLCLRHFLRLQVLDKDTPRDITLPSVYAVPRSFKIRYQQQFCMYVIVNISFYCIFISYLFDKYRGCHLSCRPILTDCQRVWFLRIPRTASVPRMQCVPIKTPIYATYSYSIQVGKQCVLYICIARNPDSPAPSKIRH